MKLRDPRTWLSFLAVIAIALMLFAELRRTSPGELSRVHAQSPELAGSDGCVQCHGEQHHWDACLGCHAEIAGQLKDRKGFHGTMRDSKPDDCGRCHGEHKGEAAVLADTAAFWAAGIVNPKHYDHAALGFTLEGKHTTLACRACHANADAELIPKGAHRFLGLAQNCESCHKDPHEGRMARACADCHGQSEPFKEFATFKHTEQFPLVGSHGKPGCLTCHPKESGRAIEVLAGRGPVPSARECVECHKSPHGDEFIRGVAEIGGVASGASCLLCHPAQHAAFNDPAATVTVRQHAATGFPLEPPHDTVKCAACHKESAAAPAFKDRYPGRAADDCIACHTDPHKADFSGGPFEKDRCLDCHSKHTFKSPAFGAAQHERTGFALEAGHAAPACVQCHKSAPHAQGLPQAFRGAKTECASCHADVHGKGFTRTATAGAGCAECHKTSHFADVDSAKFDHGARTPFALAGAHALIRCEACHAPHAAPDADGRKFGRAAEKFPALDGTCKSCHADPHGGKFDQPGMPAAVDGRTDCARCHTTRAFKGEDTTAAFNHQTWTRWPLEGSHAKASCAACHSGGGGAGAYDASPLSKPPRQGSACASCHADPHAGQFASGGSTDCASCHDSSGDFRARRFDHQRHSRFTLDDTHAALRCEACHVPWPSPRGEPVVRYKPLGTQCIDCHPVPLKK